ncbi:MAG TPA: HAD hydrolase-like protein, partial [Ardenticatenaceae bacterium]
MKKEVSVVITDLDNTLFDWVEMWYCSFKVMLDELVRLSGIEQRVLETEIQRLFQQYGTSEYPFVIQELPLLLEKHSREDLTELYRPAMEAYCKARKASLHLYPGVLETLQVLRNRGCMIIAFTESMGFYTIERVNTLGLDSILDFLFSPPDHALPPNVLYTQAHPCYNKPRSLRNVVHRFTPEGERKPNAVI